MGRLRIFTSGGCCSPTEFCWTKRDEWQRRALGFQPPKEEKASKTDGEPRCYTVTPVTGALCHRPISPDHPRAVTGWP